MNDTLYIILYACAILLLLVCGAFFAGSETAYTSLSRIKIRQMIKQKVKYANIVSALREKLDFLITTVLIGTNLVTTLNSALVTAFALKVLGPEYVKYGTFVISILVIIFSEIIPKTYALVKAEKVAQGSALIIYTLEKIFFPVVWLFQSFSRAINLFEKNVLKTKQTLLTEEELMTLIEVGETEGTLEAGERKMLSRIFEFADLTTKEIMRHRSFVKFVNVHDDMNTVIEAFAQSGYSRLPVYEDDKENIIGVVHYKAVVFAENAITCSKDFVRICMRPVLFVPETFTAIELLQKFKKEKDNFAVVLNEYSGVAGIVTMDDILKGVFGRISDEYGNSEVSPEKRINVINTNEFLVPGDMKLDDLNEVLNLNLGSENFDTLGGWILERSGELPPIGYVYKNKDVIYIVEDQSSRRIQSVRIRL